MFDGVETRTLRRLLDHGYTYFIQLDIRIPVSCSRGVAGKKPFAEVEPNIEAEYRLEG